MKEFLNTYADDILNNHDQIGQVCFFKAGLSRWINEISTGPYGVKEVLFGYDCGQIAGTVCPEQVYRSRETR